jgi:hypothetical protein
MKARKVAAGVLIALTIAMILFSGITKIIHFPWSVEGLSKQGLYPFIRLLGAMEITFLALFLIPKTMRVGFLLLSCYYAGAMATELSHAGAVVNAAMPLAIIWVTAFLRDSTIFFTPSPATSLSK